jgi:hypothetical protein
MVVVSPMDCGARVCRRLVALVMLSAVVLLPWIVYLAVSLPSTASVRHWPSVWVGLDIGEAIGLASTGWLAFRRDRRVALVAVSTATMLVLDAWFDVCTSEAGQSYAFALIDMVIELAEAAACLAIGWLVWRGTAGTGEGR